MALKLQYPIKATHENLAFRKDKQVMAPNTPITITDDEKKESTKSQSVRCLKNWLKTSTLTSHSFPRITSWKKRCVTLWMPSRQTIKHLVRICCSIP